MSEPRTTVTPAGFGKSEVDAARRLLVIANETLAGRGAADAIEQLLRGTEAQVLVVAPVLVSRARYWTSDLSAGIEHAGRRLAESLESLRARGIKAEGSVGDGHPLLAIEDALRHFDADRILIITHPPGRSNWLERGLVEHARERFQVTVLHAIVDLDAESGQKQAGSFVAAS